MFLLKSFGVLTLLLLQVGSRRPLPSSSKGTSVKEIQSGVSSSLDRLLRHFEELSSLKDVFLTPVDSRRPRLDLTVDQSVTRLKGESALITCIVSNKGKSSLMWKRVSKSRGPDELLTINGETVTDDERVNVLHEVDGDVYVLVIQNLTEHDSGIYSCELNTKPPTISRHQLTVLSSRRVVHIQDHQGYDDNEEEGDSEDGDDSDDEHYGEDEDAYYDYLEQFVDSNQDQFSSCCSQKKISKDCLGICDIKTLFYTSSKLPRDKCQDVSLLIIYYFN